MRMVIAAGAALVLAAGAALAQTGSADRPPPQVPPKAAAPSGPALPAPAAPGKKAASGAKKAPAATPAVDKQAALKTARENIADCMRLWEPATHMTRQEWARTCQRIQSRLENLRLENMDTPGLRKKAAPGRQGSLNRPGVRNGA
jgi:hypothetical protein